LSVERDPVETEGPGELPQLGRAAVVRVVEEGQAVLALLVRSRKWTAGRLRDASGREEQETGRERSERNRKRGLPLGKGEDAIGSRLHLDDTDRFELVRRRRRGGPERYYECAGQRLPRLVRHHCSAEAGKRIVGKALGGQAGCPGDQREEHGQGECRA